MGAFLSMMPIDITDIISAIAKSEAEIDAGKGLDAKKALAEMRATLRI